MNDEQRLCGRLNVMPRYHKHMCCSSSGDLLDHGVHHLGIPMTCSGSLITELLGRPMLRLVITQLADCKRLLLVLPGPVPTKPIF